MATQFLRKIILEELQKVLKEADYPDIPGSQPGQDMSYMPSGPSGMTKRSPLPGEKDFMGPAKTSSARRVGDPKVKKLQNILASVGYDVGKIDGVPGKLLFKAISDANKDMSGVGVPPERVAKDFMSSGPMAADEFISMFSDPQQLAALRKAKAPAGQPNVSAGQTGMSVAPPAPPVATDNLGITRKEEEPKPVGPTAEEKAALTKKAREEREAETKVRRSLKAKGFEESIRREINKLLKML